MKLIYEPTYEAGEYAGLAANLYNFCPHGCRYCYAARLAVKRRQVEKAEHFHRQAEPRAELEELMDQFANEVRALWMQSSTPVFMSFMCDPYNPSERLHRLTRRALITLAEARQRACILTKAPSRAMDDLTLIGRGGHILGTTLTTLNPDAAKEAEPNADPPSARLAGLEEAAKLGITIWASLEPILWPRRTLEIVQILADLGAHMALGPLNHEKYNRQPDWRAFWDGLRQILERAGYEQVGRERGWIKPPKTYYLKQGLARRVGEP